MNKKKFMTMTFALTLMVSSLVGGTVLHATPAATTGQPVIQITTSNKPSKANTFKDVKVTDWFYSSVMALTNKKLISGYEDQTFKPNQTITVAEFTTIMVRSLGKNPVSSSTVWYEGIVDEAKKSGLIQSDEFSNDDYNRNITRGEMARMIVRAMKEQGLSETELQKYIPQIKDYQTTSSLLRPYILKSYAYGIMSGYTDGTFKANETATRAEASAMIQRYIDPASRNIPDLTVNDDHDGFVDEFGKPFKNPDGTPITITQPKAVDYYKEIMKIVKANPNYDVQVANNDYKVTVYLFPKGETHFTKQQLKFAFYFNPEGSKIDSPYYIEYNQPSEVNKQMLKDTLKVFYPTGYMELFNKMMILYSEFGDDVWKAEGYLDGRRYFATERFDVSVMIGKK